MDKRVDLFEVLKNEDKLITVHLYPSKEVKVDPYEKNKVNTWLNPIPIKAYVTSLSFESLKWKYYGHMPMGSKQILCETKWLNHLKIADRIKIGEEYFKTYKDDDKGFAILSRDDYLVVVVEKL